MLPVLRPLPGQIIGPGHNSAVLGPDGRQWFCVYHNWFQPQTGSAAERVMAIDRLDWVGERLTVLGPSVAPQPVPNAATFVDYFEQELAAGLGAAWECQGGSWLSTGGAATQPQTSGMATARCLRPLKQVSAEVCLRFLAQRPTAGCIGLKLLHADGAELTFALWPQLNQVVVTATDRADAQATQTRAELALPPGFVPAAFHLLRVEVNGAHLKLALDERAVQWEGTLGWQPDHVALFTQDSAAAFAGFALTAGWEDDFTQETATPLTLGWQCAKHTEEWRLAEQQLWFTGLHESSSILSKELPAADYELVINVKLAGAAQPGHHYGFMPALDADGEGPLLTVEQTQAGWAVCYTEGAVVRALPLPTNFDPAEYQQFRFRQRAGRLRLQHEATVLGELASPAQPVRLGLLASRVVVAFDLVRVTALV